MKKAQRGGIFFRLLALLMFAVLVVALYAVRYPLLRLAAGWWLVEDRPDHADAILVLGDDNIAGDRAAKAADLFRDGLAPLVVASGRMLRPYAGIAELIARDLEMRGVPTTAIVRFPQQANNTREEAQALRDLVRQRGWSRVLVVTSNYHARRARYIFSKVFPPQVAVLVIGARDRDFDPDRWWETRQSTKLFFLETTGYLAAIWDFWNGDRAGAPSNISPVPASTPAGK